MELSHMNVEPIAHYYGDTIRALFFSAVALSFVSIPFWGHVLPFSAEFEVFGGIVFIVLAGLTSPHSKAVILADAFVSGIGAFLLELSAISLRSQDPLALLIVREVSAILLIAALYFSVKTLRAISQGKIGESPRPWEFERSNGSSPE